MYSILHGDVEEKREKRLVVDGPAIEATFVELGWRLTDHSRILHSRNSSSATWERENGGDGQPGEQNVKFISQKLSCSRKRGSQLTYDGVILFVKFLCVQI